MATAACGSPIEAHAKLLREFCNRFLLQVTGLLKKIDNLILK
jgi:hypothetical protein